MNWCLGPESNRYGAKHRGILSPLRLPIPPPRHRRDVLNYMVTEIFFKVFLTALTEDEFRDAERERRNKRSGFKVIDNRISASKFFLEKWAFFVIVGGGGIPWKKKTRLLPKQEKRLR